MPTSTILSHATSLIFLDGVLSSVRKSMVSMPRSSQRESTTTAFSTWWSPQFSGEVIGVEIVELLVCGIWWLRSEVHETTAVFPALHVKAASGAANSPRYSFRSELLPKATLPLDRMINLRFSFNLSRILASGGPSLVQLSRCILANAPDTGSKDARPNRRWRGNPGSSSNNSAQSTCRDRSEQSSDCCIFGPFDEAPYDELSKIAKCPQESSCSQSSRSVRG